MNIYNDYVQSNKYTNKQKIEDKRKENEMSSLYTKTYGKGFDLIKKMGFSNLSKGLGAKEQGDIEVVSLKPKFTDEKHKNDEDQNIKRKQEEIRSNKNRNMKDNILEENKLSLENNLDLVEEYTTLLRSSLNDKYDFVDNSFNHSLSIAQDALKQEPGFHCNHKFNSEVFNDLKEQIYKENNKIEKFDKQILNKIDPDNLYSLKDLNNSNNTDSTEITDDKEISITKITKKDRDLAIEQLNSYINKLETYYDLELNDSNNNTLNLIKEIKDNFYDYDEIINNKLDNNFHDSKSQKNEVITFLKRKRYINHQNYEEFIDYLNQFKLITTNTQLQCFGKIIKKLEAHFSIISDNGLYIKTISENLSEIKSHNDSLDQLNSINKILKDFLRTKDLSFSYIKIRIINQYGKANNLILNNLLTTQNNKNASDYIKKYKEIQEKNNSHYEAMFDFIKDKLLAMIFVNFQSNIKKLTTILKSFKEDFRIKHSKQFLELILNKITDIIQTESFNIEFIKIKIDYKDIKHNSAEVISYFEYVEEHLKNNNNCIKINFNLHRLPVEKLLEDIKELIKVILIEDLLYNKNNNIIFDSNNQLSDSDGYYNNFLIKTFFFNEEFLTNWSLAKSQVVCKRILKIKSLFPESLINILMRKLVINKLIEFLVDINKAIDKNIKDDMNNYEFKTEMLRNIGLLSYVFLPWFQVSTSSALFTECFELIERIIYVYFFYHWNPCEYKNLEIDDDNEDNYSENSDYFYEMSSKFIIKEIYLLKTWKRCLSDKFISNLKDIVIKPKLVKLLIKEFNEYNNAINKKISGIKKENISEDVFNFYMKIKEDTTEEIKDNKDKNLNDSKKDRSKTPKKNIIKENKETEDTYYFRKMIEALVQNSILLKEEVIDILKISIDLISKEIK